MYSPNLRAFLYELCPCCPPLSFSLPSPHPKEADTQATNSDFFNSSLKKAMSWLSCSFC